MNCIEILLPRPLGALTYTCDLPVKVGARVIVPLGESVVVGVVRAVGVEAPVRGELKSVIEVLDALPLIGERELRFIDWIADYYLCGKGDVLRAIFSPLFSAEIAKIDCRYFKPKRVKVDGKPQLINVNLRNRQVEKLPPPASQFAITESITLLHAKQKIDLSALVASLIDGEKPVLVLAPTNERAAQIMSELEPYFRAALCSNITTIKRRAALMIDLAVGLPAQFTPQVIVGTRAALGIGYQSLGAVVIVDEESFRYRSQRVPLIWVRDAALMLASLHGAKSVLISEFPTVESFYNARHGAWAYLSTDARQAPLRSIVLEHGKELISKYLRKRIAEELAAGKRVVLMQNRRGMASYIECVTCGHIPQCASCSTSFTAHRHLLGCHYCGATTQIPEKCEKCGGEMELRGRGTQRIEDQISILCPDANIVRIDSDMYAEAGFHIDPNWQIAIGTKMVIEAIDWAEVGVASILNVDNMISTPNFRASEETFRTVGTMAARCCDADAELVVQSSALGNADVDDALNFRYESFYIRAIEDRRAALFPPHSRMIRLTFRGEAMADVVAAAKEAEAALRQIFAHRLSPMYQPLVERQSGDHIIEMLLKIERGRSSAKAKELLRSRLSPIISRNARSKVAISAQSDPL